VNGTPRPPSDTLRAHRTMTFDLLDRIRRFVRTTGSATPTSPAALEERFTELAWEAFAFQAERIGPVRALAESRGVDLRRLRQRPLPDWREIPPVPALAYKSLDLWPDGVDPAGAVTFRSSGTTSEGGARRSVHRHPFSDLYRGTIDSAFPGACLPRDRDSISAHSRVPMLSLIPSRDDVPDSSLSFMIDHALTRWGTDDSRYALGPDGLDAARASAWVRDRAAKLPSTPCLVLATAFALATWLDRLGEAGERFRLPPGSVLFETGGFKGRHRELSRDELTARVEAFLGVPPGKIVREYGMTELTSQLYTRSLDGGDPELFVPPRWVRVRVLDPETLQEATPGTVGLIAVFDLANLGSAVHVLTEDLGTIDGGGLRLVGRARGAELRGCSLTAEEMTG
jgi:hypothetical protein